MVTETTRTVSASNAVGNKGSVIASVTSGASASAVTAGPVPVVTIADTDTEQLCGHKEASTSQVSDGNGLRNYRIPKHLGRGKSSKVVEQIHQQVANNPDLGVAMGK